MDYRRAASEIMESFAFGSPALPAARCGSTDISFGAGGFAVLFDAVGLVWDFPLVESGTPATLDPHT